MKTIVCLAVFNLICVLAGPAPYGSTVPTYVSRAEPQYSKSNVGIVNQFNQINDDGSYSFGYESGDGSFRIENRDVDGFVTGKYGYIDANGKVQEFEYVAGSLGGRSLGYQTRGTNMVNRAQPFPAVSTVSVAQKTVDYDYSSVDEDGDGFPDKLTNGIRGNRNKGQNIVRLTTQAQTAFETPSTVVRVVNPTPVVNVQPSVVRLTTPVQTEAPKIVRVVNPTPVVSQQQVVRLTPQRTTSIIQPARGSSSFQMIKPNRQRQPQMVQSVVRNPFVNRFSNQQFVTRTPVTSGGRFTQFIGGVNTNSGRDNFGRFVIRGNRPTSFNPAIQTIIVDDDDDFDFDDINDFDDDDDTFIIDSSSFGFGR